MELHIQRRSLTIEGDSELPHRCNSGGHRAHTDNFPRSVVKDLAAVMRRLMATLRFFACAAPMCTVKLYRLSLCCVAVSALVVSGCGGSTGPATVSVSGVVTLDGMPVPSGQILFKDAAGVEKTYAGQITDGEFSFPSTPGRKDISISSPQEVVGKATVAGGIPGDPISAENPATEIVESIPVQYNSETKLSEEVTLDGDNEFTFELLTK